MSTKPSPNNDTSKKVFPSQIEVTSEPGKTFEMSARAYLQIHFQCELVRNQSTNPEGGYRTIVKIDTDSLPYRHLSVLEIACQALPVNLQEIIRLRYDERMTFDVIAKRLDFEPYEVHEFCQEAIELINREVALQN